ncbi:MAG: hypothetical protein K6A76_05315 [Oribacterium sp.]|nr:hypothetical protein [Oribacterium sp.]
MASYETGVGGTDERGSITKGKYDDFLLVDKDVLSCPVDQIHEAGIQATYFLGELA